LKRGNKSEYDSEANDESNESELGGGGFTRPASSTMSRGLRDMLAQDDAEIAALEKALRIKGGNKLPKSFRDDGLDDVLGDLGSYSESESRKRKREATEWLKRKRRKPRGVDESDAELTGDEDESMLSGGYDYGGEGDKEGGFEDFDEEKPAPVRKVRENPYVAPVTSSVANTSKYIPPSRRAPSPADSESQARLRRQVQGALNKLSEANLVSILGDVERLYQSYPRQNVTSTLIKLLLGLICDPSALSDMFVILHAGFIAAVYKVMGIAFGAELVQKMVETFDHGHDSKKGEEGTFKGKEAVNLMSLLSQLYNVSVIGSALVFDYVRLFLTDINESNTELLLKIIRSKASFPYFTCFCPC
jgi:nucleolar MIF4G domain-containing protein 1